MRVPVVWSMLQKTSAEAGMSRERDVKGDQSTIVARSPKNLPSVISCPGETHPRSNKVKRAGKVFFFARSPLAPKTTTVKARFSETSYLISSLADAERLLLEGLRLKDTEFILRTRPLQVQCTIKPRWAFAARSSQLRLSHWHLHCAAQ